MISFFIFHENEEERCRPRMFEIFYKDLLGRQYRLEGQYQYGDDLARGFDLQGGPKGFKKERVFPNPARLVLQEI